MAMAKKLGSDKSHLKIDIETKRSSIAAIGFGIADLFDSVKDDQQFDICYSLEENEWDGRKSLQLQLCDLKKNSNTSSRVMIQISYI